MGDSTPNRHIGARGNAGARSFAIRHVVAIEAGLSNICSAEHQTGNQQTPNPVPVSRDEACTRIGDRSQEALMVQGSNMMIISAEPQWESIGYLA